MAVTVSYKTSSPYSATQVFDNKFLDILNFKPIPAQADDVYTAIAPAYHHRPDLMSYDLYGTSDFWYVFMLRNIDIMKHPIYDFIEGTKIYIPKKSTIIDSLE